MWAQRALGGGWRSCREGDVLLSALFSRRGDASSSEGVSEVWF